MKPPLVAIIPGPFQTVRTKFFRGRDSIIGVPEFDVTSILAGDLHEKLTATGIDSMVFDTFMGDPKRVDHAWIGNLVNSSEATLVICIRLSTGTVSANGHEYRYWHESQVGEQLALLFAALHQKFNPKSSRRNKTGIKAFSTVDSQDGHILRNVMCPALACHPIYSTNPHDWMHMMENMDGYSTMLADGVLQWLLATGSLDVRHNLKVGKGLQKC